MGESQSKSVALGFLTDVIDGNRIPRKAVAYDIGKLESALSQMLAGAQSFGLDDVEKLDRDIQIAWFKRYGKELGLEVRELDQWQLNEEAHALIDQLNAIVKLSKRVGRPAMARMADVPAAESQKRSA